MISSSGARISGAVGSSMMWSEASRARWSFSVAMQMTMPSRADLFNIGNAFFVTRDRFRIGFVARGQHDYREIFIDERIGAVLHFPGGIAFGMDVGDLLQLKGALESDRIVDAPAEIEKIGVTEKLASEVFVKAGLIRLQNRLHLVRDARELLHQLYRSSRSELAANLSEVRSQEKERGQLRGEGFCGGHADFRTGVGDNRSRSFARDHRAHDVANGESRRTLEFCFALSSQCVGGFAGLADADGE